MFNFVLGRGGGRGIYAHFIPGVIVLPVHF